MNGKKDGTILCIDFINAFRSISLRWFNLVIRRVGLLEFFLEWFWKMYEDLGVVIVVKGCKSDQINVKRGFMEGHPASIAAFVVSLIPFMVKLDQNVTGLEVDGIIHKSKLFANNLKLFIKDLNEIFSIENIINDFEIVSGVKIHRDPSRGKCQALSFGTHQQFQG